ncbi:Chaperone protein papD precursor [Pragia fontium]|uniref:Pili assembly chaperone PapD, C-terminal domain n=1 Tax=Pragia fontium DSM 5563 = ATCC 49100 TaxID=1122977 RepID=A0AAJ4W7V0_9GAMM|nr:fimbria/pilus periplasmic chaperone [Pragia fontium]SFC05248.1 Pili assembly chaperone PapD, C-terminal domain [Pragia fontium DSM 5563 = ATCC 49100]SUB81544.1 Chaperone protein papD precursor [Pragia fontium]
MKNKQITARIIGIFITLLLLPLSGQAAVTLDRTRVVFDGGGKSVSLNINNDNQQQPYLAQAWLEDEQQNKLMTGPLVITPPVQRLEPGAKSMIRITAAASSQLPQDKESLFYLNLREIPPVSDKPNVLQIALQTKIKLFYRPKALKRAPDSVWQDQLVLHAEGGGYRIENPTPYYITVIGLGGSEKQSLEGDFETVMLSPNSSARVKSAAYGKPYLTYINDYGGRPTLAFRCSGSRCVAR